MKNPPDDFYEWQEGSTGGDRRPDAPRYPAVPTAPDKRKAGRNRKAPKGEGLTICVRLNPAAIKALDALKSRGLKTTAAVNMALIDTTQVEVDNAAQLQALINHVLQTKKEEL